MNEMGERMQCEAEMSEQRLFTHHFDFFFHQTQPE